MSACDQLTASASAGVAPALRAVDCLANETTAAAFGRLFGGEGGLVPALTALLTLYIAFFAFSLLTGRSRIGISALTPRMMTLGLVLTFATSWIAYQTVVWNLAVGAPDQIASVLTGANGSATQIFADRIDLIFAAIAELGGAGADVVAAATEGGTQGSFTPGNLMWLGAIMLLLGTVGVLVTARIALAVLLAVGPVFVVLALFNGSRGLFVGWLRGLVMTAVTPLFVVVGGGLTLELLVPIVAALRSNAGIDGRASLALFLIASVHLALMVMMLKVSGSVVSAWTVFGFAAEQADKAAAMGGGSVPLSAASADTGQSQQTSYPVATHRSAPLVPAAMISVDASSAASSHSASPRTARTVIAQPSDSARTASLPSLPTQRARGIGSRFAAAPPKRLREYSR